MRAYGKEAPAHLLATLPEWHLLCEAAPHLRMSVPELWEHPQREWWVQVGLARASWVSEQQERAHRRKL